MSTLLAFAGPRDPSTPGLLAGTRRPGPVLSLLEAETFDSVVLFHAVPALSRASETEAEIKARFPGLSVEVIPLEVADTAALELIGPLRLEVDRLLNHDGAESVAVLLETGWPPADACWMLLATDGLARARFLHVGAIPLRPGDGLRLEEIELCPQDGSAGIVREPVATYGGPPRSAAPVRRPPLQPLDQVTRSLGLVWRSALMQSVLDRCAALAMHQVPVVLQGETGTGKEKMARLIHGLSSCSSGPFVPVNCGALPAALVESILFGHRKGAFTGAVSNQLGKFQLADGGTLFLDELGELPLDLQPRLLRVLEDGLVEPLGAERGEKVDVRILAATNRVLSREVAADRFREDLYYRLSLGVVEIPPLRERAEDIELIALTCLDQLNLQLDQPRQLAPSALVRLQQQPWKGNVRELQNVLGRSVLWTAKRVLGAEDLIMDQPSPADDPLRALPAPEEGFSLEAFLAGARKQLMLQALEMSGGQQSAAARLLGVSPQAISKFLKSQAGQE